MSFLWMCLSLLYAASFLQSGASSDEAVSLRCDPTVEVAVGETAILNCSILCEEWVEDCRGLYYFWNKTSSTNGSITCNSDSNHSTYMSLTISNVMTEENYTTEIVMDCGHAESSVNVQIKQSSNPDMSISPRLPLAMLSIFAALLVSGILYFLFGTVRGRKMIECIKKKTKTPGHSCCMDTAGEGQTECLTNSEISV